MNSMAHQVSGETAPGFERIRDVFLRNFAEDGDLGAAFAATINGEAIVDLWGGYADSDTRLPWESDTACMIFSGTKGLAALCMLLLVDRELLRIDDPVSKYWPEFAAEGKSGVLVRHVLEHTAGVPTLQSRLQKSEILDFAQMASSVALEKSFWPAGEVLCYHPLTYGWIVGELVKRIDGRSIGRFFADELAGPLNLDTWIGLPSDVNQIARLVPGEGWGPVGPYESTDRDPTWLAIVDNPSGRHQEPLMWNSRPFLEAEVPAINAVSTARSVAKLYAELSIHPLASGRLISHAARVLPTASSTSRIEYLSATPWALGFGFRADGVSPSTDGTELAIGFPGAGGSIHGLWPRLGVSFSYVVNELRGPQDKRGDRLLKALFELVRIRG